MVMMRTSKRKTAKPVKAPEVTQPVAPAATTAKRAEAMDRMQRLPRPSRWRAGTGDTRMQLGGVIPSAIPDAVPDEVRVLFEHTETGTYYVGRTDTWGKVPITLAVPEGIPVGIEGPQQGERYEDISGGETCRVVRVAYDGETGVPYVVYKSELDQATFAMPLAVWATVIEVAKKRRRRFRLLP